MRRGWCAIVHEDSDQAKVAGLETCVLSAIVTSIVTRFWN
jgi:hypothetical protein